MNVQEYMTLSQHKFVCSNCKKTFIKYYADFEEFKIYKDNSTVCEKCNLFDSMKLFVLTHNNRCYDIYYSNNSQSFFITDKNLMIIATCVKNIYKLTAGFTMQKLSVPYLFSLEMIIRKLPSKLQRWYYAHGDQIYCFNGLEYEFTTNNMPLVDTIISNIGGITVEHKNIVSKKIIKLDEKYTLNWVHQDETVNKNTARNLFEINVEHQNISYNNKIIAYYKKFKKKKIIISWLNEVNVAELNVDLNDIIKAMRKSHPKYEVNFYNETELV